jgi:hypothetical protein
MLCGDPESPVELHSEDYAMPYLWDPPAAYELCRNCHRNKLHKRFADPDRWRAFLLHVRRGGYARDLKDWRIAAEVRNAVAALRDGRRVELRQLRPRVARAGEAWIDALTLDPRSLQSDQFLPKRHG